jgi:hypothetical protein
MSVELYESEINRYPQELQTPTAVLYAIVRSVSIQAKSNPCSSDVKLQCHHYIEGTKLKELQVTGPDATFLSLLEQVNNSVAQKDDSLVVEYCDRMGMRMAKSVDFGVETGADESIQRVFDFEKKALVTTQISKLLSSGALPMSPQLTLQERSVKETELLSLSSLSACDLYRADQLQYFEKILRDCTPVAPNFTGTVQRSSGEDSSVLKRRYFRKIPAFTFPQILSCEAMREPCVISKYYPMTDQLLLTLHWPAPDRRMKREIWSPKISPQTLNSFKPKQMVIPPTVQDAPPSPSVVPGRFSNAGSSSVSTAASRRGSVGKYPVPSSPAVAHVVAAPVVVIKEPAVVPVVEPVVEPVVQHNLTITPAGNAIVMIKQTTLTQAAWLSIYTDENILGLRYGSMVAPAAAKGDEMTPAALSLLLLEKEKEKEKEREREMKIAQEQLSKVDPGSTGKKKVINKKGSKEKTAKEEKLFAVPEETTKVEVPEKVIDQVVKSFDEQKKCLTADEKSPQSLELKDAYFFCHTEDDVRMVSFLGALSKPSRKPDKHGTVCLSCVYPSGLQVLLSSNGSVKCTAPTSKAKLNGASHSNHVDRDPTVTEYEKSRLICVGANVVRYFSSGPYAREVMSPSGTRTLIRNQEGAKSKVSTVVYDEFHSMLLRQAPTDWQYVRLTAKGGVLYYTCPPGTIPEDRPVSMVRSSSSSSSSSPSSRGKESSNSSDGTANIRAVRVDAETFAEVSYFEDGRLMVLHRDGLRELYYPDGTRIVTHPEGSLTFVSKVGLPSLEVDTEQDRVSTEHSRGIKAPLAKGGDKVRLRIALPDGSAGMIKYDTRITSDVNGSIKLVRRDRTVLLMKDNGVVTYSPRTAWDDEAVVALLADSRDTSAVGGYGCNSPAKFHINGPTVSFADDNMMRDDGHHILHATDKAVRAPVGMAPMAESFLEMAHSVERGFDRSDSLIELSQEGSLESYEDELTSTSVASLIDPLLPLRPTHTKFTIHLKEFTCKIEDHEHNVFDLSLTNPLCPKMQLSGEVEGLKPTAVSVSPLEPRLFIVNRSADATEVLSTLKASELERVVAICPDAFKTVSSVASQPVDLGAGKQHTYYFRQRTNMPGDAFLFSEVFVARPWQQRPLPAAVSVLLLQQKEANSDLESKVPSPQQGAPRPHTTVMMSLIERMPLSQEGYKQLTKDFHSWEMYKLGRVRAMNSFLVEDSRAPHEIEEEERIKKAIRTAYKAARVKRKHAEKEVSLESQGVPSELALGAANSDVILEGDDELSDSSDEESVCVNGEEVEVRAAFESYADVSNSGDFADGMIPYADIRSACIQIFNCHVMQQTVDQALDEDGYCDLQKCSLNLDEFRSLLRM